MMKKCIAILTALLLSLAVSVSAMGEIIASPKVLGSASSNPIGFVSITLDNNIVTLVLSGFNGRVYIKNNKPTLGYLATIVVGGKTVKAKTAKGEGENFIYTFKSKKLPEAINVIWKDIFGDDDRTMKMILTDTSTLPAGKSAVMDDLVMQMITKDEAFKGKGNFTTIQSDTHIGGDIMLKGSSVPKSFFKNSLEAQNMLLIPLSTSLKLDDPEDALAKLLLAAQMGDGTKVYDVWYNERISCLLFDTQAYADKELNMAIKDGVLVFDAVQ